MPENPNLLSSAPPPGNPPPVPIELYWSDPETRDAESDRTTAPFAHYLWVLRRYWRRITLFIVAAVICTYIVSNRITPIYESTVTIAIDRQTPIGVVGQDSTRATVNDSDQFLLTQVKLIQSDAVIRPVAEQFHLSLPEGEGQIALAGLSVARVPGTYLVLASYRSPYRHISADIANAIAKSYRDYSYDTRYRATANLSAFMEKQMEELKAKTERSSAALAQYEQDLSMIDPAQKTSIISARLVQLNTDYGMAQGDRVAKESVWHSVQSGTVESLQVSGQGAGLQVLSDRISDASHRLADVQTHLGVKHPEYVRSLLQVSDLENQFEAARANIARRVEAEFRQALGREEMLSKEFQQTKAEFDQLNSRSLQYTALKREADTDRALYEELVRKIKEASINAGFQNNSINISDVARPGAAPVYPNTRSNVLEAFLLSLVLAIATAILYDKFDNTIRDPDQARSFLGTDVIGNLPMVRSWDKQGVSGAPNAQSAAGFEEAIRTLRASLVLGNLQHPLKSVMVTSIAPSDGKTTIAVELAIAHARDGHKTLLIDGDLRRPGVHTRLGVTPETGLAAALTDGLSWRDKLLRIEIVPNLTVLPTGPASHDCATLIGGSLKHILAAAAPEYDLVVVDSPPALGFCEPLQMAVAVDGVVVVTVAGETDRGAASQVLANLRRLHANVLGLIVNKISSSSSDGYYYDRYCSKYYARQSRRSPSSFRKAAS